MQVDNFTVAVTIGRKVRTRVVAIDIWGTDLDTVWLLQSRRMALRHCVRRETFQTYGEAVNTQKMKAVIMVQGKTYHESQKEF